MDKTPSARPRKPAPAPAAPISAKLAQAELSIQRGEFEAARDLLARRIDQGMSDYKTQNLLGLSLAHLGRFDEAARIFRALRDGQRVVGPRVKAAFNMGQALFYRDLARMGDLSIARGPHIAPPAQSGFAGALTMPFAEAIEVWESLLRARPLHADIILTYLSFAYLQAGEMDRAIDTLRYALSQHENFFITHYVVGRIFLDLYYLGLEGNDYPLDRKTLIFFEIEEHETGRKFDGGLFLVQKETYLDIAMQAFIDARELSPMSVEVLLWLCEAYLLAGLFDEAEDALNQAEAFGPDSAAVLEMSLRFHEAVQSPPDYIVSLIHRVKQARRDANRQVFYIIPSHFLF